MNAPQRPLSWLRHIYHRLLRFAGTRSALIILTLVTFFNSSVFPVPQDAFLLPMLIARPNRAFHYATLCTVVSCLGGVLGYFIGRLFYDTIGHDLIEFYGHSGTIDDIGAAFDRYGWLIIVVAGITPFPYKIITITCGFLGYALIPFVIASLAGRAIRFYFYAVVFSVFGPSVNRLIEKWFGLVAVIGLFVLAGLFFYLFQGFF